MKRFRIILAAIVLAGAAGHNAATAAEVKITVEQCEGSAMPYPTVDPLLAAIPDSLTPVFINHVGRHGARFMSSAKTVDKVEKHLRKAEADGTLTDKGRQMLKLCESVRTATAQRWGALDSLGMAEQRAIASRMHKLCPDLFNGTKVNAIASRVPRCVASMDEFTHQLTRLNNNVEIYTSSGPQNSPLVRPWESDTYYQDYINAGEWRKVLDDYAATTVPTTVAKAMGVATGTDKEDRDFSRDVFKIVSACGAMGMNIDMTRYLSKQELALMWSVSNLEHYLTHSASTLSQAAPQMTSALVSNLIKTLEEAASGKNPYTVMLRFGHAETMMPLLAQLHIPGCYYMTNYFDTVEQHWRDFYVIPMASNLRMILLRTNSGRMYVRVDFNEVPTTLIPGRTAIYTPLADALEYMNKCLPIEYQL